MNFVLATRATKLGIRFQGSTSIFKIDLTDLSKRILEKYVWEK